MTSLNTKSKYYLHKVKTLPTQVLVKKALRKVRGKSVDTIDRIFANALGTEMTDTEFLRKAWDSKYKFQNLEELRKHFYNKRKPEFFIDSSKRGEITSVICEHFSDALSKVAAEADKVCEHIFNLLGSGDVNLGKKIDWHLDFKTGYCWSPKKYYKDIEIPYGKADIKLPWELSRFQHLAMLGEAYWLTNNKKYSKEFVNQICDWIDNNKPKFGINWHCTMDVAIRVCNWILGYYFFKDSKGITDEFLLKFLKSILIHGKHIRKNLEYSSKLTSNHYLSDIAGLVYLGTMFPEFKEATEWKDFGIQELVKEMKKQVYPDGVDFEASTCYHRLVLELFFFSTLVVVINDEDFKSNNYAEIAQKIFGKEYVQRLYKMFEFVLHALKPNGKMPQIGDNDSGRLYIFAKREVLDMRYLLTLGAIFFKEPKFKVGEFGFCEEVLWVFGEKGYNIWQNLGENCLANIGSRAFPNAGWYIMRNDKNYMIISCGPNGQNGNGGHCHNDKLGFELCIDGEVVIVDPGTYVYTPSPDARNKFRSTASHNTVMINDKEQNRFNRKNLFQMKDEAGAKCLKWKTGDKVDIFIGEHYGYKQLFQIVIHRREIKFYKKEGTLEITDRLEGTGKHNLEWNLILSPELKQKLEINSDKLQWHKVPAFYSPEYGLIIKTEKFISALKALIPAEVKFSIES